MSRFWRYGIACGRALYQCRRDHRCRLSGGEASAHTAADDPMDLPHPTSKGLLAGKGDDGDRFCENLILGSILPVIPLRSNRKMPAGPDCRRDKNRDRLAMRCDKTVLSFERFLDLAAARLWLQTFANAAWEEKTRVLHF